MTAIPLILQVTETATGGVGRHMRDLLTGLDAVRFRQAAVVARERTPVDWEAGLPWPVRRIGVRRNLQPLADAAAYRELLAIMRELRPDLVHTHSSKAGFLARRAAWRLGIPAVYTPHVFAFQAATGVRGELYVRLERRAAHWGRRILTVGEAEREEALARRICAPEQITLIRNGVRPEDYRHAPGRAYRSSLGVPADAELLLAVGELRPQKDYGLLLEALAHLVPARPRLRCLIAGQGAEGSALRGLAERLRVVDRVTFLGHREDAAELLGAADALVMTSRYEGCPYALLEAMAAGTPVVAAPAPGVDELARGGTALLAGDRRPEALAEAIAATLDDPEAARERADRAQAKIAQDYTLDRMLAEIAALYDQCLTPSR